MEIFLIGFIVGGIMCTITTVVLCILYNGGQMQQKFDKYNKV